MALSRPVNIGFWSDKKVRNNFSVDDKIVFLYLLTNVRTQQLGIYELPLYYVSLETGLSLERVTESIKHLEELDVIKYSEETEEVAILNYLKYSIMQGGATDSNCYDNIEKKVKDKTLIKAVYEKLLKVEDNRPTFKNAFKKIEAYIKSKEPTDNEFDEQQSTQYYNPTANDPISPAYLKKKPRPVVEEESGLSDY